ncbi:MAG: nitronate monooxygenase [Synergistaceae bacterium]|jgi:enoyl-[acyl-carrier protein] reductase II|nr:nitronate monooxygenase [Synergistaceae bacterium]
MSNRVCEVLGIEYPVIQGAMAWTSMAPLVAAISEAGGLGVLGSGFMPPPVINEQISLVRKMTSKPFAANIFLDPGEQLESNCKAIADNKVPVVYLDTLNLLAYDMAKKYYDRMREAGCKIVAKVNCLQDGLIAEKAGADVIIAKGVEGGGHKTKISGRVLLEELVENIGSVPIVASGGIYTPRQVAGCFVGGAEGVELGTGFIATNECPVHPNVKNAIIAASDIDIVCCGECTGEASWQIKNKLAEKLLEIEASHPRAEAAALLIAASQGSLAKASLEGDTEIEGAVMSGQTAGLIHETVPVRKLVADLCAEAEALLKKTHSIGI